MFFYFFFADVGPIRAPSLLPRSQKAVQHPERSLQRIFPSRSVDTLTVTESTFRLVTPLNPNPVTQCCIWSRVAPVHRARGSPQVYQMLLIG